MTNKQIAEFIKLDEEFNLLMDFQGYGLEESTANYWCQPPLEIVEEILTKHLDKIEAAKLSKLIEVLNEYIDEVEDIIQKKAIKLHKSKPKFPSGGILPNQFPTYAGENGEEYVIVKNRKTFEDDELY